MEYQLCIASHARFYPQRKIWQSPHFLCRLLWLQFQLCWIVIVYCALGRHSLFIYPHMISGLTCTLITCIFCKFTLAQDPKHRTSLQVQLLPPPSPGVSQSIVNKAAFCEGPISLAFTYNALAPLNTEQFSFSSCYLSLLTPWVHFLKNHIFDR